MKYRFNKKGQLSIVNIIFFLVLVAIVSVVSVVIDSFINASIIANNVTGTSLLLMQSIVPMIWIGVIITFFLYVTPVRPQQY
jgi:hypothetical protein